MRMSLKAKVLSLAVLPVLLFALVISLTTLFVLQEQARKEVEETRQRLLSDAKATLQSYVAVAMTAIKPLYDAAAPGDDAARAQAVKLLSSISYGKDGYFFGYDSNTVRLFKANSPEGVGQSFKDNRDPNGVYVNRDLVKVAKDGTHYLQYSSPLPGNSQVLVPKLGYTEFLPKWDMAVGTSVNLDGIEAQVALVEAKVHERMEGVVLSIVGIALLAVQAGFHSNCSRRSRSRMAIWRPSWVMIFSSIRRRIIREKVSGWIDRCPAINCLAMGSSNELSTLCRRTNCVIR